MTATWAWQLFPTAARDEAAAASAWLWIWTGVGIHTWRQARTHTPYQLHCGHTRACRD